MNTKKLGCRGEAVACKYLAGLGWSILQRNYTNHIGEIDIIARDGDTLVFVEVKARRTASYGRPALAVDRRKQTKLIMTARGYLLAQPVDCPCRFDVAEVYANGADYRVELIKNAFECR